MTIYLTPFDPATKQCTAPSEDSGFATVDEAVEMFGPGHLTLSARLAVYEDFAVSDYVFLDAPVITE
jgi:hypothetical protein